MLNISFARASVKAITSDERRLINLDFKLEGSTVFNKLVFHLTSRHREYMSNIVGHEDEHWPVHQQILADAVNLRSEYSVWIGKGQERKVWRPGVPNHKDIRMYYTGALLVQTDIRQHLEVFIEDWHIGIDLYPNNNERFPLVGEYRAPDQISSGKRGQWK